MLGNLESKRGSRRQDEMLDDIIDSMNMSLNKFREIMKDKEAWCAVVHGVTKNRTQLSN